MKIVYRTFKRVISSFCSIIIKNLIIKKISEVKKTKQKIQFFFRLWHNYFKKKKLSLKMATKSFSVSCKCRSVRIVAGESLDSNKRLFNTLELPAFLNPKLFQVFRLYSKSIVTQHEANIKVSNRNSGFYHIMCRSCQFDFFVKIIENNAYLIIPNNYADSIVV